jgi:uncharacterized membrane protein
MSDLIAVACGSGGRVIRSSLSTEAEEKLQEALSATGAPV